jgi:superfamily II RNA helicase
MVKICPETYPDANETTYKEYFDKFPFPLSPFQKHSIEAIVEGHHVLVTAHTGSGKTVPAEFAIQYFVGLGKKVIYTTPIKALSNQKYYEFTKKYPDISVGLQTGDVKTNPDAQVVIMTTEILMNYLFVQGSNTNTERAESNTCLEFQIDIQTDLACVVFDEVHYINDADRGSVWEKSILMLPPHIQMIMLSATIDNPSGFAKWCERGQCGKSVWLASTNHRVVPLSHYGFLTTTEAIFKSVKDKAVEKFIRDTTNVLIPLQDHKGGFNEAGYRNITKTTNLFETHHMTSKRKHVLNQLGLFLREREMLPAIAFVFSRKNVELCAAEMTVPLLEDDSKVGYTVRHECEQIVRKLPNFQEYLELPEYNQLVGLLEKGIGIHHSGMIPILREIVELMISKRYIKLLFATESFAIGLDCPIKTAIFTSLTKFDGKNERFLMAHEYTQMAGRAGRRGIDTVGHVVHCNNLFLPPTLMDYKTILGGMPQKLISKFHVSYGLVLNLLKNSPDTKGCSMDHICEFSQKSMVNLEIADSVSHTASALAELTEKIEKKQKTIELLSTPKTECETYIELESKCKNSVNKKRRDIEKEMQRIKDENRNLIADIAYVKELAALNVQLKQETDTFHYMQNYINVQTQKVCEIMVDDGFIVESTPNLYEMTPIGKMASNIAEIHPLILSNLAVKWNYFKDFSSKQLVGLFSCFTNVKVMSDDKMSIPAIDDMFLKNRINDVVTIYSNYDEREACNDVRTGLNYVDAIIFDMIDFSMEWCDCSNEMECKQFIQHCVAEKNISVGDFTKAMLKIVTIAKEWINVCEMMGQIETLHKLSVIESMVLKYVTTAQSLYI